MTEPPTPTPASLFAQHHAYLFAVAYRMLGTAEDAEDVLQDAWLRFAKVPSTERDAVEHPRAYLVTIVTRLCLDQLRSARHRREEYVGIWLPEPVRSAEALPDDLIQRADSASFAFMLLLERLNPVQRVVLILHDVFDYTHDEIAAALDTSPSASRQTLRRARRALGTAPRSLRAPTATDRLTVTRFLEAARAGDLEAIVDTLAPDVVLMSDGGGKVAAANRPLAGRERVGRFLGAMRQMAPAAMEVIPTELNGQAAMLIVEEGRSTNAFLFDVTPEGITGIYVVRNPTKLERLAAGGLDSPGVAASDDH